MKVGEEFKVSAHSLLKPLEGRIVTVTVADEEPVTARIKNVDNVVDGILLVRVPNGTKE